jgi:hypothetical protein
MFLRHTNELLAIKLLTPRHGIFVNGVDKKENFEALGGKESHEQR